MNRRSMVMGSVALGLTACNSPEQGLVTVATDVRILATGLQGVLARLGPLNIPGLTPALMANVGVAVSGLIGVADAVARARTLAEAQPLVSKVGTYVNAVVNALIALPLPPEILIALQAAAILLPVVEALVGLVVSRMSAPRIASGMNVGQARMVLVTMSAAP